jgi:hypothetical protein
MRTRSRLATAAATLGAAVLLSAVPAAATASAVSTTNTTATTTATTSTQYGVTNPRILAHFDFATGQTAESLAVEPGGAVDISMASANNVVRVAPDGSQTVLAQFPTTGSCAILRGPSTLGLVRSFDGSLYVVECSGDANQGVWRISPGRAPVQIAQLPPDGFANGLALDPISGNLYVTDSKLGEIWQVPTDGAAATVWASSPAFQPVGLVGVIGVSVHAGSVWAANSGAGTILRIPIRLDGSAGTISTVVSSLTSATGKIDVFGPDNTIAVPLVVANEVEFIQPGGTAQVVLTGSDGLQNPTSAQVYAGRLYVTSGAYLTSQDPNLLTADITC